MQEATKYLKERQWSMGNGQCPDCKGVSASWHGHPLHMNTDSIGHEPGCALAAALRELGEKPLMKGEFTSDLEYEHYISDEGFYGTRRSRGHWGILVNVIGGHRGRQRLRCDLSS